MSLLNDALRQSKSESRSLPTLRKGMSFKPVKILRRNNSYWIWALAVGIVSAGVLLFSYFHADSTATTVLSDTPSEASKADPIKDVSNSMEPISLANNLEADSPLLVDKTTPTAPTPVKINVHKVKHPQDDKVTPKAISPKVRKTRIKKTIQMPSDIDQSTHLAQKAMKKEHGNHKTQPQEVSLEPSVSPLYEKARLCHGQKRFQEAIDLYREILKIDTQHFDAHFNLISAYLQTKEFGEAHVSAADLFRRRPNNPEVMLNLAIASIGIGDAEKGLALLKKARQRPGAPLYEIYFHMGVANRHLGKMDKAVAYYRKAEHIKPGDPPLLFNLAVVQDQQQHYEEAVEYYLKYIRTMKRKNSSIQQHIEQRIQALQAALLSPPTGEEGL
jgi:tetratricopeptide (TPR) repeat protein